MIEASDSLATLSCDIRIKGVMSLGLPQCPRIMISLRTSHICTDDRRRRVGHERFVRSRNLPRRETLVPIHASLLRWASVTWNRSANTSFSHDNRMFAVDTGAEGWTQILSIFVCNHIADPSGDTESFCLALFLVLPCQCERWRPTPSRLRILLGVLPPS